MAWPALDRATGLGKKDDGDRLLWQRCHRAAAALYDQTGAAAIMRASQGDRQGDGPAAQRYNLAQDLVLETWMQDTLTDDEINRLTRWDDWSESWKFPRHIQFADDAARTATATTPEQLVARGLQLDESLGTATAPLGLAQNRGKLQMLFCLSSYGRETCDQLMRAQSAAGVQNKVTEAAIHLGCIHERDGTHTTEVAHGTARADRLWSAWHGVWNDDTLEWKQCCMLFRTIVQESAIRGLEACVLREQQYRKLEACLTKQM